MQLKSTKGLIRAARPKLESARIVPSRRETTQPLGHLSQPIVIEVNPRLAREATIRTPDLKLGQIFITISNLEFYTGFQMVLPCRCWLRLCTRVRIVADCC